MFKKFTIKFIFFFVFINGPFSLRGGWEFDPRSFVPNPYISEFKESWKVAHHDRFFIHAIPKCGTHLIHTVIQLMIPYDINLFDPGLNIITDADMPNSIGKIFGPFNPLVLNAVKENDLKVIAVIRDPRDALVSHAFYMRTFAEEGPGPLLRDFFTVGPEFDSLPLEQQITSLITGDIYANSYIDFYKNRLGWALDPYSLTVKFEDLVQNKVKRGKKVRDKTILSIAQYLNMPLHKDHLKFVLNNMSIDSSKEVHDGKIFKRASTGNWKTFLTEEHKALLKEKIGAELIDLGYEKDFNW